MRDDRIQYSRVAECANCMWASDFQGLWFDMAVNSYKQTLPVRV